MHSTIFKVNLELFGYIQSTLIFIPFGIFALLIDKKLINHQIKHW